MPSHPLSFRKTRAAVRAASDDLHDQGKILNQHAELLNAHSEALKAVATFMTRSFWQRLVWLVTGR